MAIIPDILAALFLLIFLIRGSKKGFVHTLIHSASFFITIIVSFVFLDYASQWVLQTPLGITFKEAVRNFVLTPVKEAPELLLKDLSLPDFFIKGISESEPVLNIAETLSSNITSIIINLVVFIILFFAVKIILKILDKTLGIVTKIPVIKQLNSLLGAVMGAFCGVLWLYFITAVVSVFSFIEQINMVMDIVSQSTILSYLYTNNLILGLFS